MTEIADKKLLEEIERAFSNSQYPGDDNLVYDNSANAWPDVVITKADLRGKHWKDLTIETINYHRDDLPALTPTAFCFYLPAFLIACISYSDTVDVLPENLIYSLSKDYGNEQTTTWHRAIIEALSPEQKGVLVKFLEWLSEDAYYLIPEDLYKRLGKV